ncbi:MAG: 30S ribosomal protein S9 [Candidatus Omnitrophica bacterium]|nr:30S ribosomal protein S9 [Candidatus Omnitrophota bacterium]
MDKSKAFYATGHRKCAVARVWVARGEPGFTVNDKNVTDYFRREHLLPDIYRPLEVAGGKDQFGVWATISGGGEAGQAGALRHGIARALIALDESLRPKLRKDGLVTRDPRKKERKKYGQKGARKRFQYTKR